MQLKINWSLTCSYSNACLRFWQRRWNFSEVFLNMRTWRTLQVICTCHHIFIIGLHSTHEFHPIVKYEHYQISSGARASLHYCMSVHRNFRKEAQKCTWRKGSKKIAKRSLHEEKSPPIKKKKNFPWGEGQGPTLPYMLAPMSLLLK